MWSSEDNWRVHTPTQRFGDFRRVGVLDCFPRLRLAGNEAGAKSRQPTHVASGSNREPKSIKDILGWSDTTMRARGAKAFLATGMRWMGPA